MPKRPANEFDQRIASLGQSQTTDTRMRILCLEPDLAPHFSLDTDNGFR